ncbi:E3 UBIQUITIN-PROTEIN LIGASE LUL4 ISOFORM X1-RELATED [Salix viminalis]|uniref:RING-type E3 ubiquitin transferase n=1 Tax=Salix viminalis TaxID=40686 RepID=A0A9Q0ZK42_SALVM|nr:E3 UBIQUITIN-PROTEIN LIGASE LUL4 ISOFORM X1-RELATED [Salix viminalis]
MGSASSRNRRNHRQNNHIHHHQNPQHPSLPSSTSTTPIHQPPSFSNTNNTNNLNPQNSSIPYSNNSLTNTPPPPPSLLPPPTPPLQQPQSYYFAANAPYSTPMIPTGSGYGSCSYRLPPPPPSNLPFNNNGWGSYNYHQSGFMGPPLQPSTQVRLHNSGLVQPPRYVEHNQAKTIKNAVNVNKASIKVVADENNLGSHLVSFTFDAVVDGSITIFYFAKEGDNCTFVPVYPEIYVPRKIPFEKGVGQKFSQPSGSGIDLGFFELDQLSMPSPGEDIFPLVIFAEASSPSLSTSTSQEPEKPLPPMSTHAQITEAFLDKNNEGHFQVKVIKQILWIEGIRYELREIFGIANSDGAGVDETDSGKECIICMTEPKDTAVLPCRHMCLCSGCAKELRSRSDRCPICRQPIQELMEIKLILNKEPVDHGARVA